MLLTKHKTNQNATEVEKTHQQLETTYADLYELIEQYPLLKHNLNIVGKLIDKNVVYTSTNLTNHNEMGYRNNVVERFA